MRFPRTFSEIMPKVGFALVLIGQPGLAGCQDMHPDAAYTCAIFKGRKIKTPSNEATVFDYDEQSDNQYWWDCDRPRRARAINLIYTYPNIKPLSAHDFDQLRADRGNINISEWKHFLTLSVSEHSNDMKWQIELESDVLPKAWGHPYRRVGKFGRYNHLVIDGPIFSTQDIRKDLYYDDAKSTLITCDRSRRELVDNADIGVCELKYHSNVIGEMVRIHFYGKDVDKAELITERLETVFSTIFR